MSRPTGLPTVILGYVFGPLRMERAGGGDRYFQGGLLILRDPIRDAGDEWAVTHLQKKSKFGFLITWPFCLHFYYTFKFQERKIGNDGVTELWVPRTEQVLYWRFGKWRWDAGDSKFIGPWTWYLGLRWD